MKKFKLILAALVFLTVTSCKKYLDTNVDPNVSAKSRVDLVLTSAEVNLAYAFGGRSATQLLVWNQYWTGDQSVVTNDWDKNTMQAGDGSLPWNSVYARSLTSLQYLVTTGNEAKYAGVAKILMAYEYQLLVDLYGDVPFTDALKGADPTPNRAPSPDKDVDVYSKLLALVDDGLAGVATPTSGAVHDIAGDLIFNGDVNEWTRFGNSLKLKILMRQTNTGDATIQTKVADLVSTIGSAGFAFQSKNYAGIEFTSDPAAKLNANPLYTELEGGALKNYYYASKTIIDYLLSTTDPRIDFQFTPPQSGPSVGVHIGLAQGDQQGIPPGFSYSRPKGGKYGVSGVGDPKLYGPQVPYILMSNWEIDFLLAEAAARTWIPDPAQPLYEAAVTENFNYFGAGDPSAFLSTGSAAAGTGGMYDAASLATQLKSITLQKWVSMDGIQPTESWIESRRLDNTSNPVFMSPGGIFENPPLNTLPTDVYPSVLLYSEQEVSFNPNVHQHSLTDKVFWDK